MASYLDPCQRSTGPSNDDDECPICQEEVSKGTPTLTHTPCGRWFDEGCLMEWRRDLGNSDALIDIEYEDGIGWLQEAVYDLECLAEPLMYHVRSTTAQVTDIMHSAAPHIPRHDLESLVFDAVHKVVSMILYEAGLDDDRESYLYPTATVRDIVRDDAYEFDSVSQRHLWTAHRVLDCNCWFLVRLAVVPDVGVWLPWLPEIRINYKVLPLWGHQLPQRLATRLQTQVQPGEREVLSIPLATGFICDRFKPLDDKEGFVNLAPFMTALDRDFSATHWCLVNTRDTLRRRVAVVPWREGQVKQSFRTLDYHGRTTTVAMSDSRIWDPEIEKPIRDRFIAQHALMSAHSDYLLSGRDGEGSKELAEECAHILRETYNIVLDGDIRMEEDEKWPMDTVESEEVMTEVDPMEVV